MTACSGEAAIQVTTSSVWGVAENGGTAPHNAVVPRGRAGGVRAVNLDPQGAVVPFEGGRRTGVSKLRQQTLDHFFPPQSCKPPCRQPVLTIQNPCQSTGDSGRGVCVVAEHYRALDTVFVIARRQ